MPCCTIRLIALMKSDIGIHFRFTILQMEPFPEWNQRQTMKSLVQGYKSCRFTENIHFTENGFSTFFSVRVNQNCILELQKENIKLKIVIENNDDSSLRNSEKSEKSEMEKENEFSFDHSWNRSDIISTNQNRVFCWNSIGK